MPDVTVTEENLQVVVAEPGPQGAPGQAGSAFTPAADSGTGAPVSGSFTVTGGNNITTAVSGATVTVNADLAGTVTSVTPQGDNGSGTEITGSGNIKVAGTAPISTNVVGDTITVTHDTKAGTGTSTNYPGSIEVDSFGHVLGVGTSAPPAQAANNLSDLANAGTARTNLGLGSSSTLDVPSSGDAASGEIVKGNDSRLTDARTPTTTLEHDANKITTGQLPAARGGTGLSSISTLLNSNTTKSDVGLGNVTNIVAFAASDVSTFGATLVDDADAATARTTLGLGNAAILDTGIGNTDLLKCGANVSQSDFLRINALSGLVEGRTAAEVLSDIGAATSAQGTKADSALQDVVSDTTPQLGGNLDVQARTITTSTTNGSIVIDPPGTGFLQVEGTTNPGKIRLMCETGSHGVGLKSPAHSAGANYDLVLPTATGSANEALKTDGSGNLGWGSFVATSAVSTFGGTLIDDANAAAARTTLGGTTVGSNVFTAADQAAARSAIGVGTGTGDMVGSNNLSDVTNVGTARTNLGATTVGANVFTAADAAAARSAIGAGSGTGDLVASNNLSDLASAATARTNLGITNTGSYTGHIETAANKTYVLDPSAATDRTISAFYIKVNSGSGTVSAELKVGTSSVKTVTASTSTGVITSLHPGASVVTAGDAITLVFSSNSSATDVIFSVEYTE